LPASTACTLKIGSPAGNIPSWWRWQAMRTSPVCRSKRDDVEPTEDIASRLMPRELLVMNQTWDMRIRPPAAIRRRSGELTLGALA
jgi:hypothetical protein